MLVRPSFLPVLLVIFSLSCGSSESSAPKPATACSPAVSNGSAALSGTLVLTDVSLFQTVRHDLTTPTKIPTPIIAEKGAMARTFASVSGDIAGAGLCVEVHILDKGADRAFGTSVTAFAGESEDNIGLSSTDIPASVLTDTATLSVNVRVAATGQSLATWPAGGKGHELLATKEQGSLKLTLVPVAYNADGSGRVPDLSEENLAKYRNGIVAYYPNADVQLTIHEPIPFDQVVAAPGNGFSGLLNKIAMLRQEDKVAKDVYYIGMVAPKETFAEFCKGGCTAGISLLGETASSTFTRASLVTAYADDNSIGTLVHELGHAHGRQHAPCGGASGPDEDYPHTNAAIGVWGYDFRTKKMKRPTVNKDMMSYCDPAWISDYTYAALHTRMVEVQKLTTSKPVITPAMVRVDMLDVHADGSFERTGTTEVEATMLDTQAEAAGAKGVVASSPWVAHYPHSHGGGQLVLAPSLPSSVKTLKLH